MVFDHSKKNPAKNTSEPVKVYDCDKKELLQTFESQCKAANFLGLSVGQVHYMIRVKKRNTSNKLGLNITCR